MTRNGLHVLLEEKRNVIRNRKIGLIVNHTSVTDDLNPSFIALSQLDICTVKRIFGPEHGIWGIAQDQELVRDQTEKQTSLPICSLYDRNSLSPRPSLIEDLDTVIFDIQDIGSRYYTYIYTMLLTMQTCSAVGRNFIVLDRPNPLGGKKREGNVLDTNFTSFVGLYPLPVVHGMTVGELALYCNETFNINCELDVIPCDGWKRSHYFDETDLTWIAPSPNMPTLETAIVYPGACLFEATNISEARGTTMPFLMSGAPWIDPWKLVAELHTFDLPGVAFRPLFFRPLSNKYAGQECGGVCIHVQNRQEFRPYLTGIAMIKAAHDCFYESFQWKEPPYEFEKEKMPIDILSGTDTIRQGIDNNQSLDALSQSWENDVQTFESAIQPYLLYQ